MKAEPNILLLDDEQLVLDQLEDTLRFKGYHYVFTALDGKKAREIFDQHKVDVFFCDILLARSEDGIEIVKDFKSQYDFILIYVSGCEEDMFEKALPTHPDAYIVKPFSNRQIIAALTTAWNNKLDQLDETSGDIQITQRELDVLKLLSAGHKSKDIADKLSLSPYTVQNHKARIFEKLDAKNTHDLVSKAYRIGLLK